MSEKVRTQAEKGKPVSQEDRQNMDKYGKQVKQSEEELLRKQTEQKIEGMRKNGASEEAIEAERQSTERFIRSLNN